MKIKRFAFTLAEVLITLGIIGIVAAMTMPALIEHHQKSVISSRLKKFYSSINQAIKLSEVDNGSSEYWDYPENDNVPELKEFYDKLCLYTHSTLVVNAMVEIGINNDEDLFISIDKTNAYFLEILIYACLKYLSKNEEISIDTTYILFGIFLMLSKTDRDKYSEEFIERYKDLLHYDINGEDSTLKVSKN